MRSTEGFSSLTRRPVYGNLRGNHFFCRDFGCVLYTWENRGWGVRGTLLWKLLMRLGMLVRPWLSRSRRWQTPTIHARAIVIYMLCAHHDVRTYMILYDFR